DDEDSEELEDFMIKAKDVVIVCTTSKDEISHLVVYIVEDSDGDLNMYVHHDMIISSFPLCTTWLNCPNKDEVQPSLILGGVVEKKKKKKGMKDEKSVNYKVDSHTGAVLSLA
nr:hypothetical protein [Tanacetum cinerariifolium]